VGIAIDTGRLGYYKIYVANAGNDTVSVISGNTDTKEHDITVGKRPVGIAVGNFGKIYVVNSLSDTVSS
jgi:YVTN family beta-propeller protein